MYCPSIKQILNVVKKRSLQFIRAGMLTISMENFFLFLVQTIVVSFQFVARWILGSVFLSPFELFFGINTHLA